MFMGRTILMTERHGLVTSGIPYGIVNGRMVVKDSKFRKIFFEQPICFTLEDKGHFELLDKDSWNDRFMVAPVGFHGLSLKEHIH